MNNLILRSVLGLVFLLGVLGLMLFIPAGTTEFWQAWAYLATFGGSTLLITLYLIKFDRNLLASRTQAGPTAETSATQKIIQSFASLFFASLFVVSGLDRRFGWSRVPAALSVIALALVAVGFAIVFLVFRENTHTSAVIEVTRGQKVISTGPYALVRHPMYAGAGLMMLVSPLALGSWYALPLPVALMLVIVLRLLDEEKLLAANLHGYRAYQQKVTKRLVPFVW